MAHRYFLTHPRRVGGGYKHCKSMKKYKVLEDCFCEGYLHELMYPREGLKERKLTKGDEVIFKTEFQNFYGRFYRVEKDGVTFDIRPDKLQRI